MASAIYPAFKQALLNGSVDLTTATVRAVLIDTGAYTYDSAHDFYNDLTGVVGTESAPLTSKTITNGVFDAADISFTAVTGNTVEAIVLFVDTGNASTDRLICFLDQGVGLPVLPNGGDINVSWSPSGIFSL